MIDNGSAGKKDGQQIVSPFFVSAQKRTHTAQTCCRHTMAEEKDAHGISNLIEQQRSTTCGGLYNNNYSNMAVSTHFIARTFETMQAATTPKKSLLVRTRKGKNDYIFFVALNWRKGNVLSIGSAKRHR